MSLCWFIHEHLPKAGSEEEFHRLYEERTDLCSKDWFASEVDKARMAELDARLAEISVEAPIPKKWKRGEAFMGNDLSRCDILWGNRWVPNAVYRDQTPRTAQEFANDLREELSEWRANNPISDRRPGHKEEINTIQYAIRYLERWAKRGYCIHASY